MSVCCNDLIGVEATLTEMLNEVLVRVSYVNERIMVDQDASRRVRPSADALRARRDKLRTFECDRLSGLCLTEEHKQCVAALDALRVAVGAAGRAWHATALVSYDQDLAHDLAATHSFVQTQRAHVQHIWPKNAAHHCSCPRFAMATSRRHTLLKCLDLLHEKAAYLPASERFLYGLYLEEARLYVECMQYDARCEQIKLAVNAPSKSWDPTDGLWQLSTMFIGLNFAAQANTALANQMSAAASGHYRPLADYTSDDTMDVDTTAPAVMARDGSSRMAAKRKRADENDMVVHKKPRTSRLEPLAQASNRANST